MMKRAIVKQCTRTVCNASRWIIMLLALAMTQAAGTETRHAFQLPVFQNVRWHPSSVRVLLDVYETNEPGKMESLEEAVRTAGDAIFENDNEGFLSVLDSVSKSLMKPEYLEGGALKRTRGPILAENGNLLSWKLREKIDTGNYVFAILEFSLESSDPYLRREAFCLPFFWGTDGWKMDRTTSSTPAKRVMEGIFGPANEVGFIAAGEVSSELGTGEKVLVSWPFGKESKGWKPVRILGKGRPLGADQETHPAVEVFKKQKSIVARMKEDGFAKNLGQEFLETLGEGYQEVEAAKLDSRPKEFEEYCKNVDLELDLVYLIDGEASCILLSMPQVPMSDWDRVLWFRKGAHTFCKEKDGWKSPSYGMTLDLTALYCSIDLRSALAEDNARMKSNE